ncbi:FAD-dependent oxidoreductase [Nonomuraea sp. KC401]|uniref:FAD-dependent oxidoreductase n=1 Tax=Nonomuraea longispora TaxID=1848320 RepID=A0A4V2XJ85_9ACTN|nr:MULTISPECIES: FAD-dependent oxidoreductase [Nonomuraea]NBE95670.1 FAD-dependent oxidoreductase [Nonomuraea sp. K271]TDC01666.1 FAD-dependent oxidoreductase [Nonomuraea longispora]TLF71900.1 FAD-dependent oxidoreductase [Nonomuraea sp. KC401]
MSGFHARHKVVVIGGGYAGTLAANHLRMRSDVDVTMVNPRPEFVERIRLHQFVAGTGEATAGYGTLLGADIRLVVDSAEHIDTVAREVRLASGGAIEYDYVIYAVGSTGAIPSSVPGAAEFAFDIAELEAARRLRARLDDVPLGAPVTVVGGGLTGIETAAELAERGRRVTLVCGRTLAPSLSEPGRRSVARWLSRHGVTVLEETAVSEVGPDEVVFAGGGTGASALTVWAAGFGVPQLAAASGLRTDALGRLLTDETLTSVGDGRIVAAGDAASPSGRPLRMSCYAAGPLGAQAANTVMSRIAGTDPVAITLAFTGSCVSLGRRGGVRQFARKDDSAMNVYFDGRMAAAYKEMTCNLAVRRIRREARVPGSYKWFRGGRRAGRPAIAARAT